MDASLIVPEHVAPTSFEVRYRLPDSGDSIRFGGVVISPGGFFAGDRIRWGDLDGDLVDFGDEGLVFRPDGAEPTAVEIEVEDESSAVRRHAMLRTMMGPGRTAAILALDAAAIQAGAGIGDRVLLVERKAGAFLVEAEDGVRFTVDIRDLGDVQAG